MTLKRGIIGLFILVFLLSSVSLAVLVYDDQKDLSSRASNLTRQNFVEPTGLQFLSPSPNWEGDQFGLPVSVTLDHALWSEPEDTDLVFRHRLSPVTIRLLNKEITLKDLQELLGSEFISPKIVNISEELVANWTTQRYQMSFLGEKRAVTISKHDSGITAVSVFPENFDYKPITDFLTNITVHQNVKGASTPDQSAKLATIVRPSVVMVLNRYCSEMKFFDVPSFPLSGKNYPFCFVSVGSGFFIDKNGYLATNGHVVKNFPLTTIYYAVANGNLDPLLSDFLQFYLSQTTKTTVTQESVISKVKESHTSKESIYQMAGLIGELYKRNYLKINNEKNNYYLQLGNNTARVVAGGVETTDDVVTATLVDYDYAEPDDKAGFVSSDIAILKTEGKIFPALPLGKIEDAPVGSNLQVIGFPGGAMGAQALVVDTTENSEPTFTKGVVSAIKDSRGGSRKLIQTDATINHGNSGGPAVNEEGKVVGIATYGLNSEVDGSRYNFLRDVSDLNLLLVKNNITPDTGELSQLWRSGMENYWLSYYKYSLRDFQKIKDMYPVHPMVEKYLEDSQSRLGTSEDLTPRLERKTRETLIKVSGWSMFISLFIVSFLVIKDMIDQKKRQNIVQEVPTF